MSRHLGGYEDRLGARPTPGASVYNAMLPHLLGGGRDSHVDDATIRASRLSGQGVGRRSTREVRHDEARRSIRESWRG